MIEKLINTMNKLFGEAGQFATPGGHPLEWMRIEMKLGDVDVTYIVTQYAVVNCYGPCKGSFVVIEIEDSDEMRLVASDTVDAAQEIINHQRHYLQRQKKLIDYQLKSLDEE